jgi:hypothetical protein
MACWRLGQRPVVRCDGVLLPEGNLRKKLDSRNKRSEPSASTRTGLQQDMRAALVAMGEELTMMPICLPPGQRNRAVGERSAGSMKNWIGLRDIASLLFTRFPCALRA